MARLIGVAAIVLGVVLFSKRALAIGVGDAALWPVAMSVFGMLLAWSSGKVDFAAPFELLRAVGGLVLVAAGVIGFIALNFGASAAPKALLIATAVLSLVVLVVAPWLWRAASQMSDARQERLRQTERAEVAAHLHDSVLQTLSLIQRSAGDRAATLGLARRQERELREWLFGATGPGKQRDFRAALSALAGEVESLHGVPIEVVIVGDAALDEGLGAALAAAREAMVNASKHSGAARVDVYAELGPSVLELSQPLGSGAPARLSPRANSATGVEATERHEDWPEGDQALVNTSQGARRRRVRKNEPIFTSSSSPSPSSGARYWSAHCRTSCSNGACSSRSSSSSAAE